VQNLARFSPVFRTQKWQRYRIKDTERGPEVWEVKWAVLWRKRSNDLPSTAVSYNRLKALGIDAARIKSCVPRSST
jgi:hypothetical protein